MRVIGSDGVGLAVTPVVTVEMCASCPGFAGSGGIEVALQWSPDHGKTWQVLGSVKLTSDSPVRLRATVPAPAGGQDVTARASIAHVDSTVTGGSISAVIGQMGTT
jgi:hypothetical protein